MPARHGFVIPHATAGVRFRFLEFEWNYGGDSYNYSASLGTAVLTPTLVAPEGGAGYLYESVSRYQSADALRCYCNADGVNDLIDSAGVWVPSPAHAKALSDVTNPISHMQWKPPTTPVLDPYSGYAFYRGGFSDYFWREAGAGGYDQYGSPWLVKAATAGVNTARLSAQCAHLMRPQFYGGEGPYTAALGFGTAIRTWSGSSWTLEPAVAITGGDTNVSFNAIGFVWYAPTVDEETGKLTGATAVPLGTCFTFASGEEAAGPENVFGITWPLSVRGFRGRVGHYHYPAGAFTPESSGVTKVVVIWRPMGNFAYATTADTGTNPDSSGASLIRRGCNRDAMSYIYQVVKNAAAAAGWRILGVANPGAFVGYGTAEFGMDITLIDPPAPGQDVWVFAGASTTSTTGGVSDSYASPDYAFLVPGATVLPHCLPVAGGGALAGGTG